MPASELCRRCHTGPAIEPLMICQRCKAAVLVYGQDPTMWQDRNLVTLSTDPEFEKEMREWLMD